MLKTQKPEYLFPHAWCPGGRTAAKALRVCCLYPHRKKVREGEGERKEELEWFGAEKGRAGVCSDGESGR